jgi:hypothetical protein
MAGYAPPALRPPVEERGGADQVAARLEDESARGLASSRSLIRAKWRMASAELVQGPPMLGTAAANSAIVHFQDCCHAWTPPGVRLVAVTAEITAHRPTAYPSTLI